MEKEYVLINGELQHAGIKGMKWGIRRFQNPDGTLTAEGKKRYGDGSSEKKSSGTTRKRTSVKSMSDEELNRRIKRLEAEKRYRDLSAKDVKTGKSYLETTADTFTKIGSIAEGATKAYKFLTTVGLIKVAEKAK